MGHYNSTNTEVLDTCKQEDGNLRMLLYHHCADGVGEFIIGSYFKKETTLTCPHCGNALTPERKIEEYPFQCDRCDENFYKFEANEFMVYSWDWGHYFLDVLNAAEYWKQVRKGKK